MDPSAERERETDERERERRGSEAARQRGSDAVRSRLKFGAICLAAAEKRNTKNVAFLRACILVRVGL